MSSRNTESLNDAWEGVFSGVAGLWLALALIKFGNPVILDQQIQPPTTGEELLLYPWPIDWGYGLLALVVLCGVKIWRWETPVSKGLLALPLVWLGWQCLSAPQTVDRSLTAATIPHFASCVMAFYLGVFALSRVTKLRLFWLGLVGGFLVVLIMGWKQHFGGLEETRRYFYNLPNWQSYPPEFLKKLSSNRIYSTLFYPNTLAGVLLLLLPVAVGLIWQAAGSLPVPLRFSACGIVGVLGLGCYYWSGSKSGWLIALGQGLLVMARARLRTKYKATVMALALAAGVVGFWAKYETYFAGGATSVVARFDYWRAAWQTLQDEPLLGSGPGTFMVSYKARKPAHAEMARLAHNDYLQQGSDSGWVGFLGYVAWIVGGFLALYRRSRISPMGFASALGLGALAIHSTVEFGLYIPAVAWPGFLLFGWLIGHDAARNQMDKPVSRS